MTDRKSKESKKQETGSRNHNEPVFLAIGKLRRPHGLNGEWLMDIYSDFPERIKKGKEVLIGADRFKCYVNTFRLVNKGMLISFSMENADDLQILGNQIVYIDAEKLPPLPKDFYYHHQIIGMNVTDEIGNAIGKVSEILETGANDVYIIISEDKPELLLPAIDSVILSVNTVTKIMIVRLPEWI